MADFRDSNCESCGEPRMGTFVQHGSYFTRCTACGNEGPATSWLVLAGRLQGKVRAVVVRADSEENELVAEGEASQIAEAISKVAHQGKLVRLLNASA